MLSAKALTLAAASRAAYAASPKPNFIIFYSDDQGYGDLSCMGATDFQTPNLDNLAASGVRFTDWYSNAPVCGPSRAALMSGCYPGNAGVRGNIGGGRDMPGMSLDNPTIAQALKPLGYHTALLGKWHLGSAKGYRPYERGFDEFYGFLNGCIDYYSHIFYWGMAGGHNDPEHDLWENSNEIYENGEYFTESITERATDFIDRAAKTDEPFFLCCTYNAPHYPMHAPQKYIDRFPDLPWDRQIMAAMISALDDSVGAIIEQLEQHGLRDNTFVFFQSDNGPSRESRNWLDGTRDPYYGGTTGKLKGHKFSVYEGGIRVPAIMSWPAQIPGGRVLDEVGATMDIFPTFLKAAGGDPAQYNLDGVDILSMVAGNEKSPHDYLYWESGKQTAVRHGPWKLVLNGQLVEEEPGTEDDKIHLSNLDEDLGERTNLKDKHPEITNKLKTAAEQWRKGIDEHNKKKPKAR